jgi:hypothetical protein
MIASKLALFILLLTIWNAAAFTNSKLGQPLPKPKSISQTPNQRYLDVRTFSFRHASDSVVCELISVAFNRYYKTIFFAEQYANEISGGRSKINKIKHRNKLGLLKKYSELEKLQQVTVKVNMPCEDYPSLDSDESCIFLNFHHNF